MLLYDTRRSGVISVRTPGRIRTAESGYRRRAERKVYRRGVRGPCHGSRVGDLFFLTLEAHAMHVALADQYQTISIDAYLSLAVDERPVRLRCPETRASGTGCLAPVAPKAIGSKFVAPHFAVGKSAGHAFDCPLAPKPRPREPVEQTSILVRPHVTVDIKLAFGAQVDEAEPRTAIRNALPGESGARAGGKQVASRARSRPRTLDLDRALRMLRAGGFDKGARVHLPDDSVIPWTTYFVRAAAVTPTPSPHAYWGVVQQFDPPNDHGTVVLNARRQDGASSASRRARIYIPASVVAALPAGRLDVGDGELWFIAVAMWRKNRAGGSYLLLPSADQIACQEDHQPGRPT